MIIESVSPAVLRTGRMSLIEVVTAGGQRRNSFGGAPHDGSSLVQKSGRSSEAIGVSMILWISRRGLWHMG